MFKQRLLTALCLIPLVLLSIYYAPGWLLGCIVLALVAIGGWEWSNLMPVSLLAGRLAFVFLLLGMVWLCMHWLDYWIIAGFMLWGGILIAVLFYPVSQRVWGYSWIVGAACLLLLPLFANSLAAIYRLSEGANLVVYLFCLIWAADIGAYLVGKRWGKTKLIPRVSPGKTVEGVVGGIMMASVVSVIASVYFSPSQLSVWLILAVVTALISILGDLFISILKRRCHMKDTGQLFPGHGGMLDRFDSLIAALPFFYCGLSIINLG